MDCGCLGRFGRSSGGGWGILEPGGTFLCSSSRDPGRPATVLQPVLIRSHRAAGRVGGARARGLQLPRRVDPSLPRPGRVQGDDGARGVQPGKLPQPVLRDCLHPHWPTITGISVRRSRKNCQLQRSAYTQFSSTGEGQNNPTKSRNRARIVLHHPGTVLRRLPTCGLHRLWHGVERRLLRHSAIIWPRNGRRRPMRTRGAPVVTASAAALCWRRQPPASACRAMNPRPPPAATRGSER